MSRVYLAEHEKLNVLRVIKCISKQQSEFYRLSKEADILNNLKHPGIPELFDLEEDDTYLFIVEEYVQGESLQAYLLGHNNFSQEFILNIGIWLCSVMEYLHTKKPYPVLYLDLKPEHIIISGSRFMLIDFGTATQKKEATSEALGGTAGFAAPEQVSGDIPEETMDIYGIGSILYYAVYGKMIRAENSNSEECESNVKDCSLYLKKIIQKATAVKAAERYQTVSELKHQLQKCKKSSFSTKQNAKKESLIAVIGSQTHIGVTHLAVSFTCYLNSQRQQAVYESRSAVQSLCEMTVYMDGMKEENGILSYLDFRGSCREGQEEDNDMKKNGVANYRIVDFGAYDETMEEDVLEADFILVVAGTKPWELLYTERIVKRFQFCEKAQMILNFSSEPKARKFSRKYAVSSIRMPFDSDPFVLTREKKQIFTAILKKVDRR